MTHKEKQRLRDLADFLLLNVSGLSSSGLCRGKAGISLVLFEAAALLQDETLEEEAMNILQESILSKTTELGMESGWCGIAFSFLYLIRAGLVEADYMAVMKERHSWIERETGRRINAQGIPWVTDHFDSILFWQFLPEEKAGSFYLDLFLHQAEKTLTDCFLSLEEEEKRLQRDVNRLYILFRQYLRAANCCNGRHAKKELIQLFSLLWEKGFLPADWKIGHYLSLLPQSASGIRHGTIGKDLREVLNSYIEWITPTQKFCTRLDLLFLSLSYKKGIISEIEDTYLLSTPTELEESLKKLSSLKSEGVGLGYGIGRLLFLLCAYLRHKYDGCVPQRFSLILG